MSMVPFAGVVPTFGKNALKHGDEFLDVLKHVDEAGELLNRGIRKVNISGLDDFISNPKKLGEATPNEWYQFFKVNGYNPTPMSKGHLGRVPFR